MPLVEKPNSLEEARAEYDAAVREVVIEPEWTVDYPHLLREREANKTILEEAWNALVAAIKSDV